MQIKRIVLTGLSLYASLADAMPIDVKKIGRVNMFEIELLKQHKTVEDVKSLVLINESMCIISPEEVNKKYLQKAIDTEIKNKDEILKDILRLSLEKTNFDEENIQRILIYRTSKMFESEIKNQVQQILNYDKNRIAGDKQLVSLLANCNISLKKYNPDTNKDTKFDFNQSLDNTVNALEKGGEYEEYLNNLEANNEKSFIVAPITSNTHLFSIVARKKQDKEGKIFFEVITVNKGGRIEELGDNEKYLHSMYEKYIIPQENIKEMSKMLGYRKNLDEYGQSFTTGQVYEKIRSYTENEDYYVLHDLIGKNQVVGNCYYKELEAGLKFAYASAYNRFEEKIIYGRKMKTPKWPVETLEFQKSLINNLKDIVDLFPLDLRTKSSLKDFINENISKYEKNKQFRNELRGKFLEEDERKKIFIKYFGDFKIKNVEELRNEEMLKGALKDVDFLTFEEQFPLFIQLLEESGAKIPEYLMGITSDKGVFRSIAEYMYNNPTKDLGFMEKYLKSVYDIIQVKFGKINKDNQKIESINVKTEKTNGFEM